MSLDVEWLGAVPYRAALELQLRLVEERRRGEIGDRLLLLEHPAVITLGRSARDENLLESRESLAARGIEVHPIQRGGDVTYHAPGQLVGYLICDLASAGQPDVGRLLRDMEAALVDAIAQLGLAAHPVEGMTGVYLDPPEERPRRKLASIGVGVKHWISFHGFALNVDVDLAGFDAIVPCGLEEVEMTSLLEELERPPADLPAAARREVAAAFEDRFGSRSS